MSAYFPVLKNLSEGAHVSSQAQKVKTATKRLEIQMARITVILSGVFLLEHSPILTNPLLKRTISLSRYGLLLSIFPIAILYTPELRGQTLENTKRKIEQGAKWLVNLVPVALVVHALAHSYLDKTVVPLGFIAMYGIASLHHHHLLGERLRKPLDKAFYALSSLAGFFHPFKAVQVMTVFTVGSEIYGYFNPRKATAQEPLNPKDFRGKLNDQIALSLMRGEVSNNKTVSEDHFKVNPTPYIKETSIADFLADCENTFSSPESIEQLNSQAPDEEWELWNRKYPGFSKKDFLMRKLLHVSNLVSLADPEISSQLSLNLLALIHQKMMTQHPSDRVETILKIAFDFNGIQLTSNREVEIARDIIPNFKRPHFPHLSKVAEDLSIPPPDLLQKVLILLQELRYNKAFDTVAKRHPHETLKPYEIDLALQGQFQDFGLPQHELSKNAPLPAPSLATFLSPNLLKSDYSPATILEYLDGHFSFLEKDLKAWACTSPQIIAAHTTLKRDDLVNIETWVDGLLTSSFKKQFLSAYLIEIGVFECKK